MSTLLGTIPGKLQKTFVNVKDYGALGDGSTDDTAAVNAALAAATTTGLLTGSANRAVYFPGGTYMVSSMIEAPIGAVLIGDGPDLSIIAAKTGFTFASGATAVLKSYGAVYGAPGASRRLSIHGLLVSGSNITGANGILASPQQPASWTNWRVVNCPGYGVYLGDVQQHVSFNGEITNCGIGLHLDGASFLYSFGLNIEQCATRSIKMTTQGGGGIGTGMCLFAGLHIESNTDTVWIEAVDAVYGMVFDNVQVSASGGETAWKFTDAGTQSTYAIRHAHFANDCTAIRDVYAGKTLAAAAEFGRHIEFYDSGSIRAASIVSDGGIRVGGGAQITKVLRYTGSWAPANFATLTAAQTTVTVTGASPGDQVLVGHNNSVSGALIFSGQVSAADTVTVTCFNATAGTTGPGSGTLTVAVLKTAA